MHCSQFNDRQYKLSCQVTLPTPKESRQAELVHFIHPSNAGRGTVSHGCEFDGRPFSLFTVWMLLRKAGGAGNWWAKEIFSHEIAGRPRQGAAWSENIVDNRQTERSQHDRTHIKIHKGQSHTISLIRYWPKFVGFKPASLQNSVLQLRAEANLKIPCAWT